MRVNGSSLIWMVSWLVRIRNTVYNINNFIIPYDSIERLILQCFRMLPTNFERNVIEKCLKQHRYFIEIAKISEAQAFPYYTRHRLGFFHGLF